MSDASDAASRSDLLKEKESEYNQTAPGQKPTELERMQQTAQEADKSTGDVSKQQQQQQHDMPGSAQPGSVTGQAHAASDYLQQEGVAADAAGAQGHAGAPHRVSVEEFLSIERRNGNTPWSLNREGSM